MDYKAIANGLAARYAPAAVTPPTGRKNITASAGQPPNGIPATPYVIVWPTDGDLVVGGNRVLGEHTFLVNFYLAKSEADLIKMYATLEEWLGVLLGQTFGATKLAVTGVLKAIPMRWQIGILPYGGTTYEGITITVHVWTEETVTLVP